MKRYLLILISLLALTASAQDEQPATTLRYGYLSYDAAVKSMPAYAIVQQQLGELRAQYAAEQQRVENEFNAKYEEFLDGQKDFPQSILEKRQSELQELLDKNIAFKKESQRLLTEAEAEAMQPLYRQLADALARIGQAHGYAFILNTDGNALPYVNTAIADDLNEAVINSLK